MVVITSIVLLAVSFGSLEPTEIGLAISGSTQAVDTTTVPYAPGRYFLGLGGYFIKFPSTTTQIKLEVASGTDISARSNDGLLISLDVSYEYKLIQNELAELYRKFTDAYETPINKLTGDVVRSVAARFPATAFYSDRNNVSTAMFAQLTRDFPSLHVQLYSFQLLDITLPTAFAAAIGVTQVTAASIDTALNQQTQTLIQAQTTVIAASQQASIITAQADATVNQTLIQGQAQAGAILAQTNSVIEAYKLLQTNLTLTTDELVAYIYLQAIKTTNAKVVYSAAKPRQLEF